MRKTLLMLLAVLVCCSSLFVVAGCGPKYVDHPHVGVGECESCGANYYDLISDYVIENGELEEDTYTVELPFSHGGYIYLNYSSEDSDLDIHIIVDENKLDCDPELYTLLYGAYRSLFNKNYNITIKGIPVEIYVELV